MDLVVHYLRAASDEARIATADRLDAALRALREQRIDLVIADLHLPDSRGLDTVEALRRAGDQLIIVLTGDDDPTLRAGALERGAYDFLHKSQLSPASLGRLVRLAMLQARTHRSLRASETRLKAIIEAEPECVKLLDAQGKLLEMNPAGLRMIEADALEPLRGHCVYGLVSEVHRPALQGLIERVAAGGEGELEFEMTGLRGTRRWVDMRAVPFHDPATGQRLVLGITRDATERKRLGQRGERLARMYAALSASNEAMLRAESGPALLDAVCRVSVEKGGFLASAVMLADGEAVRLAAASGPLEGYLRTISVSVDAGVPEGRGLVGEAFRSRGPAVANDYFSDARTRLWHNPSRTAGLAAAAAFPLVVGPRAIGVLVFYSAEAGAFDPEMVALLGRIAENAGFAMELFEREEERRRAEHVLALEHSVTRCLAEAESVREALRGVIRAICEAGDWDIGRYFRLDAPANVMRFDVSWCSSAVPLQGFEEASRALAYAPGVGLVGKAWASGELIWSPDTASDARVAYTALARASGVRGALVFPLSFERRVLGVLSISSREVREPDERLLQAMRVIGSQVGQFLTRKDAEAALRESEARFRETFELAASGIAHFSLDQRFLRANSSLCRMLGYTAAELVGRSAAELSHPADRALDAAERARLHEGEIESARFEKRFLHKDGSVVWVNLTVALARDALGAPQYEIAVIEDISARKETERARVRAELALRQSEARFRSLADLSSDWYWEQDAELRFVATGGPSQERGGISAEVHMGRRRWELPGTEPISETWDEHRAVLEARKPFRDLLLRRTAAGGEVHYISVSGTPIHDSGGVFCGYRGVARDVTDRKLAEQRQVAHLRHQERIARFGQSALARREPDELIAEAAQTLLEGLDAGAVAYVELGPAQGELALRAVVGTASAGERNVTRCAEGAPVMQALRLGTRVLTGDTGLPYEWAKGLGLAAVVPVRGEHAVRGALCVFHGRPEAKAFAAEELNFMEAAASLLSTGLQRIDSEGRLAYLAQFDPLTGLPNRALLADRFAQMIVQARRRNAQLGVLFIDLDEFKLVNDSLGHAGGDALLREAAARLQAAVRPGDTVARISGDEFAVVLADLARPEDAALVAQKIVDRLSGAADILGHEVFFTASIGVAAFPADGPDAESLLRAADAAMYRAKQAGRNTYQFFTAEINQRSRARAQLGADLRRALERGEFALAYQPKFELATRRPVGSEALLRWQHPERGMVPTVEFISILEETGLIVQVGEWVLRRACQDLRALEAAGIDAAPVAVNLSARQFRQQDLDARIRTIVEAEGVAPTAIELEITESQLMQDPDHAIRVMRSLRESGMHIAIDDFGTGYSSLSYLTRFPAATLKIDRSFVRGLGGSRSDAAIVRAIIEMAHTLGFRVIAEGIETEAQAEYLRAHGCEQGQGFLFARPMPAPALAALLSPSAEARARKRARPRAARTRR